jgi:hypothetical protein
VTVTHVDTSNDPTADLVRVVTAVWFEIDHTDGSGVCAYFTDDATLTIADARVRGTTEIDALYATRNDRGPRVSRHCVTNLYLLEADARSARAISTLILYAEDGAPPRRRMQPVLVADVHDEFHRVRDRWRISDRRIVPQFMPEDADLAVPTGEHPTIRPANPPGGERDD